ncbi:universal stress protein [Litoribacter ruber]|uniref:universal stress protein n=1 Tax=Litoribacter ruber TaxID=702568 RepID=UPI001BDB5C2C|nr:universal stress protein [Litoribacter ruber]MBT0810840.1 universal stress protein [Litoribacter ruber]
MKRIVVPIDFSQYAENAFKTAIKIASKGDASITCVNVVYSDMEWDRLSQGEKLKHPDLLDLYAEAEDKLKAFVMDHKAHDIPIEAVTLVGLPAERIVELAEKQAADLIVIGAYGKGYEPGNYIGGTIQRVLRHAHCPVLAVKKVMNLSDFKKFTFASLFTDESRPAFIKMQPILQTMGSSVHCLYVNTPENFIPNHKIERQMVHFINGNSGVPINRHIFNHAEVEKGIMDFSTSNNVGWIGVASNNRKSSAAYNIGVTETILFKSDTPVFSVKLS